MVACPASIWIGATPRLPIRNFKNGRVVSRSPAPCPVALPKKSMIWWPGLCIRRPYWPVSSSTSCVWRRANRLIQTLVLCQAAASLDLLSRQSDGRYALGRVGAAVIGVPGLELMIRHHRMFYQDLAYPEALMRGEVDTQLAQYWPYVGGKETHALPVETAKTYSELMATSQQIVAVQTLRAVSLKGVSHLLDVGGGTGAFLSEGASHYDDMALTLFDLPSVTTEAERHLAGAGLADRVSVVGGSFLDDPLPVGADAISLIRVLYDHDDSTVRMVLKSVFDALPAGGRLLISEPMSGGNRPTKAGDAYFGFYTMAMTTGRPRSAARHTELLAEAGFMAIRSHATDTAFVTNVLTAEKFGNT